MEKKEPCTCGQTHSVYCPDENQHEPACWECWHRDNYVNYDESIERSIKPVIPKEYRVTTIDYDLPF
mgnify:CR=1 FL=1